MTKRYSIRARVLPDGLPVTLQGRDAWMLMELVKSGPIGLTSIQYPGARVSHYVMKCRRAGFVIECEDVKHGGPFRGTHGRYRLKSEVEILPSDDGRAAA